MKRLFLYIHTLPYLRWQQIVYRLWYFLKNRISYLLPLTKLYKTNNYVIPANTLKRTRAGIQYYQVFSRFRVKPGMTNRGVLQRTYCSGFSSPFLQVVPCYHQGAFTFLNLSKSFSGVVDWSFAEYGKLWTYHLNYFDYLNQEKMTGEEGLELIRSFLAGMKDKRVGMESYPISLRGMNWIKFLTRWEIHDEAVDALLYRQYKHLLSNLEYHILGNHLLENGFSLLFGACYFGDEQFYRQAEKILREELIEQILPDGGHFERSPMYHQIILSRVLDCINLLSCHSRLSAGKLPGEPESRENDRPIKLLLLLEETAARMLGWLEQMTFRNGEIPLMNDAAFGMSPATAALADYAARIGMFTQRVPLKDSGYRKIGNDVYEAILDVGAIGPDYIPGHAHADTLSFELHVGGMPVIVDSGTSTYEDCPLRHWQRSTRAHNTVEIDGHDSSEVWDSFRVARRAYPRGLKILEAEGIISCAHDGYQRLSGDPEHSREWKFRNGGLRIQDRIAGSFRAAVGRLHFHPDAKLIPSSEACKEGKIVLLDGRLLYWRLEKGRGRVIETTWHPEFGLSIPNRCLEIVFTGREMTVDLAWDRPSDS